MLRDVITMLEQLGLMDPVIIKVHNTLQELLARGNKWGDSSEDELASHILD